MRECSLSTTISILKLLGNFSPLVVLILFTPVWVCADSPPPMNKAELPRLTMDTTYISPRGKTLIVRRGGDFQAALNQAKPGDVIQLEAGAIFTGPFTLPAKSGRDWIIVRSSVPEGRHPPPERQRWRRGDLRSNPTQSTLPLPGFRIDPSYSHLMPKIIVESKLGIIAAPGSHHYRFVGIEIRSGRTDQRSSHRLTTEILEHSGQTLVSLGDNRTSIEKLPHHIIFDRCYFHGDPKRGARRGIAMNSRYTAVVDSYFEDFMTVGSDSQAIAGWGGPGPFKIENNYLEGAGENVMFGGADPSIPGLSPSDIEIRGNYFTKPLSWRIEDPSYQGTPWTVKNLLELKNARRVLINGNLFEYSWTHAQTGFAVLFTVRNQDGKAPWSVVEDVTLTNNVMRHIGGGVNILGYDNNHPSQQTRRILIKNNLFEDVGGVWGSGQLFQLLDGTADIVIENNTALQTDHIVQGGDDRAHTGFIFSNNIVLHNRYGIIGSGFGVGYPSLKRYFPGAVMRKNIIVGGDATLYPADNFFPKSLNQVGFVDLSAGDYRLREISRYRRAVVGSGDNIGVNFEMLQDALGSGWVHVVSSHRFAPALKNG